MDIGGIVRTAIDTAGRIGHRVVLFSTENAPTILRAAGTALVVVGAVRAYMSGKDNMAVECCDDYQQAMEDARADTEGRSGLARTMATAKVDLRYKWREYLVPTLLIGGGVACFWVGAHIQDRRMARLTAALMTAEGLATAYSDQLSDLLEEGTPTQRKAAERVTEGIAERATDGADLDAIPGEGDMVVVDGITGFTFRTTEAKVRSAEAFINEALADGENRYVSDFYRCMDVEQPGSVCDALGWSASGKRPHVAFGAQYLHDGKTVVVMLYNTEVLDDEHFRNNIHYV